MNTIPFFSVIIATYNRASVIQRALSSLISQSEQDWEALVIDDGSSDNTAEKVTEIIRATHKISYHQYPHKGMVFAKNAGIKASTGKYITFLDSDDEYHPQHLEVKRSILTNNPRLQFLYGKTRIIGNPFVPDRFDLSKLIHIDQCVASGNFVIESKALKKLKGFRNLKYGTDADFFDRVVADGLCMAEINLRTYIYHHETPDSNTNRLMMQTV